MLYPIGKNLIPDFNDPGWFSDYSAAGGTMVVDSTNPHKMSLTLTASAQGRLIWIPVEVGKTYTFSFKNCTGLYRIYKRKVGNHDAGMVLANHSNPGMPLTYTFTADDTFGGYVTLRLTHSAVGTYIFENMQLEEGSIATLFEPYRLGNKKAVKSPKNLFDYSNMTANYYVNDTNGTLSTSGAGAYATDFTPVKGNKTYVFENMPTTFPLIMRFAWYDKDKVYIGGSNYYTASNVPKEVTSPPNAAYIRSSVHPKDFPMGIFYEKNVKVNQTPFLVPKKNLIKPFGDKDYYFLPASADRYEIVSPYKLKLHATADHQYFRLPIFVKPNTTYTISAKHNAKIGIYTEDGASQIVGYDTIQKATFNSGNRSIVRFYFSNYQLGVGEFYLEDLSLVEGTGAVFEPYKTVNPNALLQPKKNLVGSIENLDTSNRTIYDAPMGAFWLDNFPISATDYVVVNSPYDIEVQVSAYNRNLIFLLPAKANTYYKPSCVTNADVHIFYYDSKRNRLGQTYNTVSGNLMAQTPANCAYIGFCMTNRGLPAGRYYFKNWQLEEVSTLTSPATPFEKYKAINKPAVLYPKGNHLPPLTDPRWYLQTGQAKGVVASDYKYIMDAPTDYVIGYDFPIVLEPGKIYTMSAKLTGTNARLRVIRKSNSSFVANVTNNTPVTFTATTDDVVVRVENNGKAGLNIVENFSLVEGSVDKPFEVYKLINKPL